MPLPLRARPLVLGGLAISLLALACASTSKMSAADVFGAPPTTDAPDAGAVLDVTTLPPDRFAATFKKPAECEKSARGMKPTAGDRAWNYLRACVDHGGFDQLQPVLDFWTDELRLRPDAPNVLAKIIAARGGKVRVDLKKIQNRRLPLFDLAAAAAQPKGYKGRYVVFLARVAAVRKGKKKPELSLSELVRFDDTEDPGAQVEDTAPLNPFGAQVISGAGKHDGASDTGIKVVGRLTRADSFLTVDRQLIFVGRFEGANQGDTVADSEDASSEPETEAIVSIVGYHELKK